MMNELPSTAAELEREQIRIGSLEPPPWSPSDPDRMIAAGCFIAFARGIEGEGATGDPAWVAAVAIQGRREVARNVLRAEAGAPYESGLLFLRAGRLLITAIEGLSPPPDVVLIDGTGRDHPRKAGVALHVGLLTGIPTVGVTDRALMGSASEPGADPGSATALMLEGNVVGYALRVRRNAKPLYVHAAWRASPDAALEVVRLALQGFRTPEPLRRARRLARRARSAAAAGELG